MYPPNRWAHKAGRYYMWHGRCTGATFWLIIEVVILQGLSGFCRTQADELNEKMMGNITPTFFRSMVGKLIACGIDACFKSFIDTQP